jgi:FdhD protein
MNDLMDAQEFRQYRSGRWEEVNLNVIIEQPVSLTVNGEVWLTFMCTPMNLDALALGFLFNETIIDSLSDVASIRVCQNNENVDVWLNRSIENPRNLRRTSGCTGGMTTTEPEALVADQRASGNGNQASLEANLSEGREDRNYPFLHLDGFSISPQRVSMLISELPESQHLYREVGGVHNSGLSDGSRIIFSAEDIGRHNTLDKLAGLCLLKDARPEHPVLLTTGRVSSEMMQKAARIGAAFVISRTSPSSLSVELARRFGITLVGYARRDRFTVYTYPERIQLEQAVSETL